MFIALNLPAEEKIGDWPGDFFLRLADWPGNRARRQGTFGMQPIVFTWPTTFSRLAKRRV
jgi:hypothetical protein